VIFVKIGAQQGSYFYYVLRYICSVKSCDVLKLKKRLRKVWFFFSVTELTICCFVTTCFQWVPVTTVWRVLGLRVEERPPIWRVAANILNRQWRTADEGWSASFGVGRGADDDSSPEKQAESRNIQTCLHCILFFVILSTVHTIGFNVSGHTA